MARVMVYTLNHCPYCKWVRKLLTRKGISFVEIDFTDDEALREKIALKSGQKSAPQVFIDDKSIGGYQEVKRLSETGELDRLMLRS